jgi:hypothetical protein
VLDRERPYVDSKLGDNGSDWFDVSGDASANVTRFRLSRASPTTAETIRLVFAIDSTPSFDDGALSSFHGSRRVTQFLQCAAPFPLVRVTRAERRELRLADSSAAASEPAIEGGGDARFSNSA